MPSKACFFYSRAFARTVREELGSGDYDAVVLNGGDLLWLLDHIPRHIPTVLFALNIEHDLYRAQLDSLDGIARAARPLLDRDWRKLRDFETRGFERVHNVIFLSELDAAVGSELAGPLHTVTLPPLFPYEPFGGPSPQVAS